MVGLLHTLAHYQQVGLKVAPADLSCTSLPQEWHKPRGKKIAPEAVTSMVLAKPHWDGGGGGEKKPVILRMPQQMQVFYFIMYAIKVTFTTKHQVHIMYCAYRTHM